jgi:hypothetical protein
LSTVQLRARTRQRRSMVFIDTRCSSDHSTRVSRLESSVASRASSLAVSLAVSAVCPSQSRPTSPRDSTARITPRYVCYVCACGFPGTFPSRSAHYRACCGGCDRITRCSRRPSGSFSMRRCIPMRRSANLTGSDLARRFLTRWRGSCLTLLMRSILNPEFLGK